MQDTTTMGNVEVLSVLDMYSPGRPVDFFFPDVPKEAWGPYREAQLDENGEIAPVPAGRPALSRADHHDRYGHGARSPCE